MGNHNPHLTRGYGIALISAAILSTTAIFIRYLTNTYQIPPLILAFWRAAFVVITLVAALGIIRPGLLKVKREHLLYLAGYGFVLAIFNSIWTISVALNGAAIGTVLAYSSAAFTAVLGWLFLGEGLSWAKLLAVAISLTGCVLVTNALDPAAWSANLVGILTGVISGLCYAIYSVMGRSALQRGLSPWTTIFYAFAFDTLFLLLFNLLPVRLPGAAAGLADLWWLGDAWAGWGVLFALAAGPTVLGFGLYIMSMTDLPSSVANLIATSEPVFTAAIAYALLGERLEGIQIAGGLIILAGVVCLRVYEGWVGRNTGPLSAISSQRAAASK